MKKGSPEWEDWCSVYEYMKKLMEFDESMKLPTYMVLRLQGLSKGKFMANKNQKAHASYPFSTILIAMKISKSSIDQYVSRNKSKFSGQQHKFNGIMIIIEKEINDVVIRLKKVEKVSEKIEEVDMSHQEHKTAQYKKKDKKENNKLNDLW